MSSKLVLTLLIVGLIAPQSTNALLGSLLEALGLAGKSTTTEPTTPTTTTTTTTTTKKPTTTTTTTTTTAIPVTEYFLQDADGRFAVYDANKKLAFLRNVLPSEASKFTLEKKSDDVYGICTEGTCMTRCERCISDTGEEETVKFHVNNSIIAWSQWILTNNGTDGGQFNLEVSDYPAYLTYKTTPSNEDQLTLFSDITDKSIFRFVEAKGCGLLKSGGEYWIMNKKGEYAVVDESNEIIFMKQVAQASASKFTTVQKSCNLYGLCASGVCIYRSDIGDGQSVKYVSGNMTQFQLMAFDPTAVHYYLKVNDYDGFLSYNTTNDGGGDQLSVSNSLNAQCEFALIEVE